MRTGLLLKGVLAVNSLINSVISLILFWVRYAVNGLYTVLTSPTSGGVFEWIAEHWKVLALILCALGLAVDVIVYLIRWQPYRVWVSFFRRLSDRRRGVRPVNVQEPVDSGVRLAYVPPEDDVYEVEEGVEARPLEELQYMDYTTDGYWGTEIPEQTEENVEQEVQEVSERRRRSQMPPKKNRIRLKALLTGETDDQAPRMKYKAPLQAGDKREAFHDPYIPPQWKEPGVNNTIPRTRHRRGNRT